MTYDQFWDGDVEMVKAYRKAHRLKLDEADQLAWLQGRYVYEAIASLAPALKAFAKGRARPYLENPYSYQESKARLEQKEKKHIEQEQANKARTIMEIWAVNFNKRFEEKEQENLTEKSGESEDGRNDNSRN